MKFKENALIETDNFWYDLLDGGYIKPSNLLEDPADIELVDHAVRVLKKFEKAVNDADIVNYI